MKDRKVNYVLKIFKTFKKQSCIFMVGDDIIKL